jgi:hypothetical protein
LPAGRAVGIDVPVEAAKHRAGQEYRHAPPRIKPLDICGFTKTQRQVGSVLDVSEPDASERRGIGLTGKRRRRWRRLVGGG